MDPATGLYLLIGIVAVGGGAIAGIATLISSL
jgi:hypothetical protein